MWDSNKITRWIYEDNPCGSGAWPRMAGLLSSGGSSYYDIEPDYFCLHLITKGAGTLRTGGYDWPLRPGTVFTHWPGRHSQYFEDASSPWEFSWIHITGSGAEAFVRSCGLTGDKPFLMMAADPVALESRMLEIWRGLGDGAGISHILSLFYALPDLCSRRQPQPPSPTGLTEQAVGMMESMMHSGLNVKELTSQLGVGRVTLFLAFKKRYGCGPSEYFELLRMAKAKAMLLTTSRTIKSIALSVGYRDQNYFSRRFRAIAGMGPRSFRQHGRSGAPADRQSPPATE